MKTKAIPLLLALALTAPVALIAQADAPAVPTASSLDRTTASRLVYGLLSDSRYAYRPRALDVEAANQVFDKYLKTLDGNRQFFLGFKIDKRRHRKSYRFFEWSKKLDFVSYRKIIPLFD